jgi:tetratricopeptide (TPR) repeat protein
MSRFVNLEFGGQFEDRPQNEQAVKDELFFMTEAQKAFETGEFEQALRSYAKVLEHNPQNPSAWTGQVRMLLELGEPREAKLWADKALEQFPRETELLAAKAVALGRTGDLQAALAFSDASIEERGETPYVWLARADVLLARKEKRADYCFDKAIWAAPRDWLVPWLAARIRFFYHQFALALKFAQQALDLDPGRSLLWLQLGQCQQALGLITAARNSFTQARELNPSCTESKAALVEINEAGAFAHLRNWWRQKFYG